MAPHFLLEKVAGDRDRRPVVAAICLSTLPSPPLGQLTPASAAGDPGGAGWGLQTWDASADRCLGWFLFSFLSLDGQLLLASSLTV